MASRSHTTFKKRQKEQARLEKRRDKAAKMLQRKLEKRPSDTDDILIPEESPAEPEDVAVAGEDSPQ